VRVSVRLLGVLQYHLQCTLTSFCSISCGIVNDRDNGQFWTPCRGASDNGLHDIPFSSSLERELKASQRDCRHWCVEGDCTYRVICIRDEFLRFWRWPVRCVGIILFERGWRRGGGCSGSCVNLAFMRATFDVRNTWSWVSGLEWCSKGGFWRDTWCFCRAAGSK